MESITKVKTWHVSEDDMFHVESQIRERFRYNIRQGSRDYLVGDLFEQVVGFVEEFLNVKGEILLPIPLSQVLVTVKTEENIYGFDAMRDLFGC